MKTSLRLAVAAGLMIAGTASAMAEPRYNPRQMSCDDVQDVIRQHGAVTLRYMSTRVRNLPLYNRYVRNSSFCDMTEEAVSASVPTLDRDRCPVKVCEHRDVERHRLVPWIMHD